MIPAWRKENDRQARAVEAARSGGAPPVRLAELARRGAQRPHTGAGPRGQRRRVHLRAEVVAPLARGQAAQQRLGLVDAPVRVTLAARQLFLGPGCLVRRGLRPRRGRIGVVLRAPGAVDDTGQLVQSRGVIRGDHLQRRHLVEVVLRCLAGQQRVERVQAAALERRQRDGVDLPAVLLLLTAGGVGRRPGRVDRVAQGAQLGTPRGDVVLSGVPLLGERLGLVLHLPQLRRGTSRVRRAGAGSRTAAACGRAPASAGFPAPVPARRAPAPPVPAPAPLHRRGAAPGSRAERRRAPRPARSRSPSGGPAPRRGRPRATAAGGDREARDAAGTTGSAWATPR